MISEQDNPIGFIGSGLLYETIQPQLEQNHLLLLLSMGELPQQECSLLVVVEDGWSPQTHTLINQYSLEHRVPYLQAHVEFGKGIIGPCVFPWESGCVACAEMRKISALENAVDFRHLYEHFSENSMKVCHSWLTTFSMEILASLVVEEISTFFRKPDRVRTRNAQLYLPLDTLHMSVHRFQPNPCCPACTHLPEDTARAASITLQPQIKLAPFHYRVRSLTAELDVLCQHYVDEQTGMIRYLARDKSNLYANTGAPIGLYGGQNTETGFGRALSYGASQGAAIAEALERSGGIRPGGKRTALRASYNQLGGQALNPITLGVHSSEQYALPNYPYVPYHPDLVCNWIWGYSFQRQQPILVPERYAYYGLRYQKDTPDRPFVYEISNGCAVGGCLEEAILFGILEVAERDSFLMTWYARMSIPLIDMSSASDPSIGLLIERIKHLSGYTVYAFNATLEQSIPCFWVMGVDEENRPGYPKVLCAAGSHLHPEKALANAIHELAPMTIKRVKHYQDEREHALKMLNDPSTVVKMEDHTLLYCLPEAFDRLSFLDCSSKKQTFREAFSDFYTRLEHRDLREDLSEVIASYLRSGMDVIIVDQTTPEHTAAQFHCVKVIIPGTLPMTFGHRTSRITGLERLYCIPHQLGYSAQSLTDAEINPYPHPFP